MDWSFPSNNNATIVGPNDAGIATFERDMYKSLVRESIQNSLDAKRDDCTGPVEVRFNRIKILKEDLPGYLSLANALKKCAAVPTSNEKAKNYFMDAYRYLHYNYEIHVLRVSDYNTSGLQGSSSGEIGSAWSRLVKESGTNNKASDAGGSFGIGKSAYYACSKLRTVFFSSLSEDGEKSNIGVSKLISFELEDGMQSMGTGFYGEDRNLAIQDLVEFDTTMDRHEPGTDIYIIGYQPLNSPEPLSEVIINFVIEHFFISILKNMLIVRVDDTVVDSNYVETFFQKLSLRARDSLARNQKELLDYYRIFTKKDDAISIVLNNEEYGKEFGFDNGDCELFLKKGEDLNRKILIARKNGMRIFEKDRISGSINFSGVLYISGYEMNKLFREMEGPAHDAWIPNQQDSNYEIQKDAYNKLKKYLKEKVQDCFEDKVGDEFEAFDVGEFLPDVLSKNGQNEVESDIELSLKDTSIKIATKKVKPSKKKVKSSIPEVKGLDAESWGEVDSIETGTGNNPGQAGYHEGDKEESSGERGTGEGPGSGSTSGEDNIQSINECGNGKDNRVNYKETEVNKRVICINSEYGDYKLSMAAPSNAKHVKIEFSIAGEQSDYTLNINNAFLKTSSGIGTITQVEKNLVYIEDVKKGDRLELFVNVDFSSHCMMEVNYNESKK